MPLMAQSSTATSILRIGSRGSPLALVQAREVQSRLAKACGLAPERIEIKTIRTTGDMIQDRPLAEAGGKGLFTKEIEEALLAGAIDLAVHSSKDMPTMLPAGLVLRRFCRARTRATLSSAARPKTCANCRTAPWSAPRRRGGRLCSSTCGRTSPSCRCAAMSRRGCASSKPEKSTPPCWRWPD